MTIFYGKLDQGSLVSFSLSNFNQFFFIKFELKILFMIFESVPLI